MAVLPYLVLTWRSWQEALLADIGLTLFYTAYAFVFYRIYDALRPVEISDKVAAIVV